jgi:hypothetical protein
MNFEFDMNDIEQVKAMMTEPLHPELQACVDLSGRLPVIAHPLIHQIYGFPAGYVNRQFEQKKQDLQRARKAGDWHRYVFIYERPYRTGHLLTVPLHGREFAQLARDVWVDSENINQNLDEWAQVFSQTHGYDWMDIDEREELLAMDDVIEIYRGVCDDGGVSWSLERKVAEFFAKRRVNGSTGQVLAGTVSTDNVFAYLASRGESEIIVLNPRDVDIVDEYQV